jgi:hypothetical protein
MKTPANKPIQNKAPSLGSRTSLRPSLVAATLAPPPVPRAIRNPQSAIRNSRPSGIALVITLLMLSVITFLAVALLILTRSHREQVTASFDLNMAQDAANAAVARAQSQIIARLKASGSILNYDYMASHNFINPNGFNKATGAFDSNNVNYDFDSTGAPMSPSANPQAWAQNIANLFFDPRPPVFIKLAPNATNSDFRFWIDLNRNGKFETNGYLPVILDNGLPFVTNGLAISNYFNGEPEWIGVLQYPGYPHSATNRFIARSAYVVLPIGKTLDFNFSHNYSKSLIQGATIPKAMPPSGSASVDGFVRDQGVGSWELNLAAWLWDLDTNFYSALSSNPYNYPNPNPYSYIAGTAANRGYAFDDAFSFLRFRYATNSASSYPFILPYFVGPSPNYFLDGIDQYGTAGLFPPTSYPLATAPWPGGYTTNNFNNLLDDVFDPNKTSPGFTNRLLSAGSHTNSYDRYMFQRLLASGGTGSAPELQTWVSADGITTNPAVQPPTLPRTKVNLNYDNSYQIANGLNTSPPVLVPWTSEPNGALAFFTNAAESLLRSQNFRITNYDLYGHPSNVVYLHFGLTNIPIYNSTNPSIRYSEQLHRMLQLAANIYDASRTNTVVPPGSLPYPSVFRPLFFTTNYGGTNQSLYIIGYASVTGDAANRINSMLSPPGIPGGLKLPSDPTITTNDNVWGIPWVVGAVKGLPAFDRYVDSTSWMVTRKLLFRRQNPQFVTITNMFGQTTAAYGDPTKPPAYTNQFFIMSISNGCGMDAWNNYANNITFPFLVVASNFVTITVTNNSSFPNPYGLVSSFSTAFTRGISNNFWRGFNFTSPANPSMTNGMLAFLQTNVMTLPQVYYSESAGKFLPVSANLNVPGFNLGDVVTTNGVFQPNDLTQNTWPVYGWTISVTNRLMYALVDPGTGQAFDFVNLGPFGTTLNLTNILATGSLPAFTQPGGAGTASSPNYWIPTPAGPGLPSIGVLNQISNGITSDTSRYFYSELRGTTGTLFPAAVNSNLYFSCSNDTAATVFTGQASILVVNDPLVHYTVGDLTPPPGLAVTNLLLMNNDRYEAWPTPYVPYYQTVRANMTLKDPQITSSDDWNFPANKFPSIGWLGRVHRGTPWQTIFLKADGNPGPNGNPYIWLNSWVSTLDTYPTNDYALLDLFTAAPNDNASRGLLSVNQTNSAPWYALLSGVAVNTTLPPTRPSVGPPVDTNHLVLDPTTIAPLLDGESVVTIGSNGQLVTNTIPGINATRAAEPGQLFHNLGSVFKSPTLTIASPFLSGPAGDYKDEEVEAIPQQVAGLLKLGQPQFVIYGFGQALKPKDIYFGPGANFNLVTNYQITGEFFTRTVCHVVGDPAAANVKIQVDSFNILPAD